MQVGYKTKINLTESQSAKLIQWVGCARFVWNQKIEENEYFYAFGSKFVPVTQWRWLNKQEPIHNDLINKQFSYFKDNEMSPWLSECPSQILRNSVTEWFDTQKKFMKGDCGRPRKKRREDGGSVWLTNELFEIRCVRKNKATIFIGTKRNNIGEVIIPVRRGLPTKPNSLRIKIDSYGKWYISFSYDDQSGIVTDAKELRKDWLGKLKSESKSDLDLRVLGIDRGITIPVATKNQNFVLSKEEKKSLTKQELKRKFLQRQLARQKKGSKRRERNKRKIARTYNKQTNIRVDFAHKTTHSLIVKTDRTVFVLEDLKTQKMTSSASGTVDNPGNNVAQKSGLNREILNVGWHRIESFLTYKAIKYGKIVFKVNASHTSQECSSCEYTHKDNRPEQEKFVCGKCSHEENADTNAAKVIGKRAVKLIQDSGTELSESGVLRPSNKARSGGNTQNREPKASTTREKRSAA